MALSTEPTAEGELDWRRPHPITIVVEIGTALRSVILAVIVVRGGFLGASGLLEFAVVLAPLAAALARWYTTRYALGAESMHHQYGLIRRRKQVLPRANVQNVSTKAGIVARLASVVELQISDASSSGDIKLRLVSQDEAERLTALLRSTIRVVERPATLEPTGGVDDVGEPRSMSGPVEVPVGPADGPPVGAPHPGPSPAGVPTPRPPLISPSLPSIIKAELTSMAMVGAVTTSLVLLLAGFIISRRVTIEGVSQTRILLTAAAAAAMPSIGAVMGVIGRVPVLGGFRLYADPDRLRIQGGLLTETKVAARRERLQLINVARDLPHQWLGIERVRYETADVELQTTTATTFLDPAGRTGGWRALTDEAIGGTKLDESSLDRVSGLTKRRMMVRLVPLTVIAAGVGWLVQPVAAVALGAGWLAWSRWYAARRYAVIGWAYDDDHCLIRSGVFYRRLNLVRLDKIQIVRTRSSWFQRRLGLATLAMSTAGAGLVGQVVVPDLAEATAETILADIATRAARTPIAETL